MSKDKNSVIRERERETSCKTRVKKTEDQVRRELENLVNCETGQLTTFKQLGFSKKDIDNLDNAIIENYELNNVLLMKPDGWKFDENESIALVCETKSSEEDINKNLKQIFSYMYIVNSKYKNVVGIIFNGYEYAIYKLINGDPIIYKSIKLENYKTYFNSFNEGEIDKNSIYQNTKIINDILHHDYKLNDLKHRMIWTACLLVAKRFGKHFYLEDSIEVIKQKTIESLTNEFEKEINKAAKLSDLIEIFKIIRLKDDVDYEQKNKMIMAIDEIADNINLNNWKGEDVMAIFFNEFTRYKGKAERGQVFTPDHITTLMCELANIHYSDHILDACCGSGSFLTKAMWKMISDAGGITTSEATKIKQERIFGNDDDDEIYALACANMLLHKDGKSNIRNWDAKSEKVGQWITDAKITKVLMNPPYEKKYKPIHILENVLNNVEPNSDCLFLMPNSKLRTNIKHTQRILKKHTLEKIIKLPDIFKGLASTGEVSIFWFKSHIPQDNKNIKGYWIKDDGLETVKNQGRHDISGKWEREIMPYWLQAIRDDNDYKYNTKKIISPNSSLEYPDEEIQLEIYEEDFDKVIIDRILFENPDLAEKYSPYSAKNNPCGISHKDWIVKTIRLLEDK